MRPVVINLERTRGDTWPIKFNLFSKKTNRKLPITGNTFVLSVSTEQEPTGSTYVFQSNAIILDDLAGEISFPISSSDSDQLGKHYYDVEMTAGTEVTTILKGAITFLQDITK